MTTTTKRESIGSECDLLLRALVNNAFKARHEVVQLNILPRNELRLCCEDNCEDNLVFICSSVLTDI